MTAETRAALLPLLNKAGLSDHESAAYVALFGLGKGTVSEIARAARLNRTTGYDILDRLVATRLISISGKEPKQEYAIESPERLRDLIEHRIAGEHQVLAGIEALMPQLRSMYGAVGRPKVRFYEGKEGLRDVYEDTLSAREPIRGFANVDDMHRALPGYFPKYYERRARQGIRIRAILPDNQAGTLRAAADRAELRESALIPADTYYFSPEINIYDDKVMIASWREQLGIILESAEIAAAMKQIYELAWAEAKRLDAQGDAQDE